MRPAWVILLLIGTVTFLSAQETVEGPSNEKAKKTYKQALEDLHHGRTDFALDGFKKADKQDGGRCADCERMMIKYGSELRDWKTAELAAQELVAAAVGNKDIALAHYQAGVVLINEGRDKRKDELFTRAHEELTKALAAYANFPDALFTDGMALALVSQDEAAKKQFELFLNSKTSDDLMRQRALRYISRPELARARMAPVFAVTTADGQHISMDDLQGKVVLIDFWATWCPPCREALPHIREIVKKFQDQPLVVLSVSLDDDEQKWKQFTAANGMTWPQYRDGGFSGNVSRLFNVTAIPHTFTIDADGVLQDEHIGDASIEGKLKKLLARAQVLQASPRAP